MNALRRKHQKLVHERVPFFFAVQDDSTVFKSALQRPNHPVRLFPVAVRQIHDVTVHVIFTHQV